MLENLGEGMSVNRLMSAGLILLCFGLFGCADSEKLKFEEPSLSVDITVEETEEMSFITVSNYDHITESETPSDLETFDLICPEGSHIVNLKGAAGSIIDFFVILCSDGTEYATRENTTATFDDLNDLTTYKDGFNFLTFKRAEWASEMYLRSLELLLTGTKNKIDIQGNSGTRVTEKVDLQCSEDAVIRGLKVVTRDYSDSGKGVTPYAYSIEGIYCQ